MRATTRLSYREYVQAAIRRLVHGLDDAVDLRELASEASLSPYHFHRIFTGMVGETPGEFSRRLRMERAARELRETELPVIEIAFNAGYDSHEAFTRAFRASWGASPTEFRRQPMVRFELAATCGIHYNPEGIVRPFIPRDTGGKEMNVEVIEMPALRIGTVRHIGPYNQIPEAFGRLGAVAGPAGLFERDGSYCLAIYHAAPETPAPSALRSDAAIRVPDEVSIPQGLEEQHIPGGRYAKYTHVGPYEALGDTWARFMGEWLPASGQGFVGPTYEIYISDPRSTPKEELRTDLYLRVE